MKEIVSELSDFVFPYVNGLMGHPGLVHNEMWQVTQDFCRVTQGWKEELILNIINGESTYPFTDLLSGNGDFERVFQVIILSDVGIIPTDSPGVPATNNPFDSTVFDTDSAAFIMAVNTLDYVIGLDEEEKFFLEMVREPTQDIENGMRITSVLIPTRDQMIFPDLIAEYKYYIAAGVKAKFFRMYSRPWSDQNAGFEEDRIYQQGVNKLRARLNQNMSSQDIYVTYPAGF